MKHIISLSGGIGSYFTLKRVLEKYNKEDVIAVYCEALNKTMSEEMAKRVNRCKEFVFNEIDVFDLEKRYKPRKEKKEIQERLF